LICNYVCRLLNVLDRKGMRQVTPVSHGETAAAPFVQNFSSGYIQRALANWPKQGPKAPWRVYQNYIRDTVSLKWGSVDDGTLKFSNPPRAASDPRSLELVEAAR
jgi:monooxygenase